MLDVLHIGRTELCEVSSVQRSWHKNFHPFGLSESNPSAKQQPLLVQRDGAMEPGEVKLWQNPKH